MKNYLKNNCLTIGVSSIILCHICIILLIVFPNIPDNISNLIFYHASVFGFVSLCFFGYITFPKD